jgi:hypothetical protein
MWPIFLFTSWEAAIYSWARLDADLLSQLIENSQQNQYVSANLAFSLLLQGAFYVSIASF